MTNPNGRLSGNALSVLATVACLVASPSVHSTPFDSFGVGARGASLAGAMVAQRADYAATHYNPANLTGAKGAQVGMGLDVSIPSLYMHFRRADSSGPTDSQLPAENANLHIGALFPLVAKWQHRLVLGLLVSAPLAEVNRIEVLDPKRPHFHRFDAQLDGLAIEAALAIRALDWLSLGFGVHSASYLSGGSTIELDLATRRFLQDELEAQVRPRSALIAGATVHPMESLTVALAYRQALALEYDLAIDALIADIGQFSTVVKGQALYLPERLTFGLRWVPMGALTVLHDLVWERWSLAGDPAGEFYGRLDGAVLGLGATDLLDASTDLAAVDTLTPRLGIEWSFNPAVTLRGGYAFLPTPLPMQSERQNYADADVHQFGMGFRWSFGNPWAQNDGPLSIEVSGQLGLMESREMVKRHADDDIGSYGVGGQLWHVGLTLRQDMR